MRYHMKRYLALFVSTIAAASIGAQQQTDPAYDVVIRNGRVLDGQGNPFILADVAIRDGKFVKIGKIPGRGRTEIDAAGKYVSPGWIDMMDQSGSCLLYTSDAADERSSVDLGGRRIIKKKK